MKFTYAEVEEMMDKEMAKPPEEMDTDFIDLCATALCEALDKRAKRNEDISKINSMNLSNAFKSLFAELVQAFSNKEIGKSMALADSLYPSVKSEKGISSEEKDFIKSFLSDICR